MDHCTLPQDIIKIIQTRCNAAIQPSAREITTADERKKWCKSLSKTKMKGSICLIMMVEHPEELTVMSPAKKQAGSPKNFHQQSSRLLQYSSKSLKSR